MFIAAYNQECGNPDCYEPVHVGQQATYDRHNRVVHMDCESVIPKEPVYMFCKTCNLAKPCWCDPP